MTNTMKVYEEIIDFIAARTSPSSLVAFHPSDGTRQRVVDLIHREKTDGLSLEEKSELNHYMELEHIMRLVKTRARKYMAHE